MNGKYFCGFQALCSTWATASLSLFCSNLQFLPCSTWLREKVQMLQSLWLTTSRAQDYASSDEEHGKVESFEFADFESFLASFRRYTAELSDTEKQSQMFKGLCNIRENAHLRNILEKMFDYDLEVGDLKRDLFSVKEKWSLFSILLIYFFND